MKVSFKFILFAISIPFIQSCSKGVNSSSESNEDESTTSSENSITSLEDMESFKPVQPDVDVQRISPEQWAALSKQAILSTPLKEYVGTSEIGRSSNDAETNRSAHPIEYKGYKTYSKYSPNAFSIKFPESWEVIENPNQYACVAILEPQKGDYFRSNFNVVITTQTRRLEDAYTDKTVKQMKTFYPDYEPLSKEFLTLNGIKCMKITSECTMEGYHVNQVQYYLKKGIISYTVSFTIASRNIIKESVTIEKVINSLNIN